jgi:hypothetical protein
MTKKLRCNVTGNLIYMPEKRYQKLLNKYDGDEAKLKKNFVTLSGKRVQEGSLEEPTFKNRIKCIVSGRYCVISNQRIAAGIKKHGSWEKLCESYICRPVKRLLREGKPIKEIEEMVRNGELPEE